METPHSTSLFSYHVRTPVRYYLVTYGTIVKFMISMRPHAKILYGTTFTLHQFCPAFTRSRVEFSYDSSGKSMICCTGCVVPFLTALLPGLGVKFIYENVLTGVGSDCASSHLIPT